MKDGLICFVGSFANSFGLYFLKEWYHTDTFSVIETNSDLEQDFILKDKTFHSCCPSFHIFWTQWSEKST